MPLKSNVKQQIQQAITKRLPLRKLTNAMRLVNGRGDHLEGLVLEQYDRHFLLQVFDQIWLSQALELKEFLKQSFEVDFLILKDRSASASAHPEGFKSHVLVAQQSSKTMVVENKLSFEVDLNDGLNTGLFLDMRSNRLDIGKSCLDKRVLNLFSYTCSFGVYAKAYQAKDIINVDISKKALDKGRRNYEINHLDNAAQQFVRADATDYLSFAVKKENRFDVIIIDPPSFARAKSKVFNIEKALPDLVANALKVLNPRGKIFVSTNNSNISMSRLEQIVKKQSHQRVIKKMIRLGQDKDFIGSGQMKESYLVALAVEY